MSETSNIQINEQPRNNTPVEVVSIPISRISNTIPSSIPPSIPIPSPTSNISPFPSKQPLLPPQIQRQPPQPSLQPQMKLQPPQPPSKTVGRRPGRPRLSDYPRNT